MTMAIVIQEGLEAIGSTPSESNENKNNKNNKNNKEWCRRENSM